MKKTNQEKLPVSFEGQKCERHGRAARVQHFGIFYCGNACARLAGFKMPKVQVSDKPYLHVIPDAHEAPTYLQNRATRVPIDLSNLKDLQPGDPVKFLSTPLCSPVRHGFILNTEQKYARRAVSR